MSAQSGPRSLFMRLASTTTLFLFTLAGARASSAAAQAPGLVAAYGFNETSGSTTADASGNNNTGTVGAGVTRTTSGKFGGGLVFNGSSGRVTVANASSLTLTTAMTLEAWVNPTSVSSAWRDVVYKGNDNYYLMATSTTSSRPAGGGIFGGGSSTTAAFGTTSLAVSTWTHLAVTYDGATIRLYVNGAQVSSAAKTGAIATSTNPLTIGSDPIYGQYFQGTVDEVRVYNRALSASEVQTDMNTPVGTVLDTQNPTVAITSPTTAATFGTKNASVTLSGTASDNVGVTQVSWTNNRGGSGAATGTTSWTASAIALQPGANVLTVTARDAAGNTGTAVLTVTSDVSTPTVAITAPTGTGSFTTTATPVALAGTASDNIGVTQVSWTNDRGGSGVASGTTSWNVSTVALQPGTNVLTVSASDAVGNVATATLTVTYNAPDNTPPSISITSPATTGSYTTNQTSLTVGGGASDNIGVTQVTWTNSAGGSGTATGTTTWSASGIALQPGTNVITVTARDAANNPATATLTVTQDAVVPAVTLTAPAAGTTVSGGTVTLTASASDNTALAGVQFLLDGATAIGSEVLGAGPSFTTTWSTIGVPNGTHTLSARARDIAGNTALSAGVSVTVSNVQSSGLVAAYGFEETAGTTVTDVSSFANNGSFGSGITRSASGKFGQGLAFNGNGLVTIPNASSLGLTNGMTLEAWVNPTFVVNEWHDLIYKGNDNYYLMVSTNHASAPVGGGIIGGGSSTTGAFGVSALAANTWTHVATTFDGSTVSLYVNGTLVSSASKTGSLTTSTNPLTLGGDPIYGQFFTGSLDEVRVYNRALSAAEIQTDMVTPVGNGTPVDAVAPTVAITNPANGGTYATTSTPLSISGTASDNVGVTQVTWTNDRGGSGTATGTTNWSVSGIALQPGTNVVTVTARDAANNAGVATLSVTYTLPDNTAPTATITSPTTNATFGTKNATVALGGSASDNVGVTQVTWTNDRGGSGNATGTTAWSVASVALQPGSNVLTVTARDAAGNTGTAVLTVTSDVTVPTVAITAPTSTGSYTATATPLAVSGTASDNIGVTQVTWTNDRGGSGTAVGTTEWTVSAIALQPGANLVTVTAQDAVGNVGVSTLAVTYNVPDNTPPTVSITAPTSNPAFATKNASVALGGSASDNVGVTQVSWTNDRGGSGTASGTTSWSVPTIALQPGANVITVTAIDAANNPATATLTVTSDVTVPTVAITAPSGTGSFTTTTTPIALSGTASDNIGVTQVSWVDDRGGSGSATGTSSWSVASVALQPGTNVLTVSAQDAVGNVGTTTLAVTYNVPDNTSPTISITSPSTTGSYTTNQNALTVGGTASDNVAVTQVSWTNDRGGNGTATGTTNWTASGIPLQPGSNVITVTARDSANNPASTTLTVTQDAVVPSVTVTAPAAGSSVSGATVTLTASASDNTGMTGVQFLLDGATPIGSLLAGADPTYTTTWSTLGVSNGTHTLSARATDVAGNTATSPGVPVTVSNTVSGLVAAYGFEEASGTSVADASSSANNGTFGSGVARVATGKFGNALSLNGGGMVTIPNAASLGLTSAMTLEAWVNPSVVVNEWHDLIYKGNDNYYLMVSTTNSSHPAGGGTFPSGTTEVFGVSALPVSTWTHVATTYDGANLRLYVNGTQVSSVAKTGNLATSTNPLTLGGDAIYGQFFTGSLDEVRVYNRALSAAEIQTDMVTPVGGGVPVDATAPVVAITNPANSGSFATNASPLAISGTASDNVGVTQVSWTNDRGGSGTASGTTSWSVSAIALQPGTNVLTVTARDAANNAGTATLNVTYAIVDATSPTVAITTPTTAPTFGTKNTTVTLGGSSSDNVGVTQVTWTNDRGGAGTASGTTSWTASGIALQPGANLLTVTAVDAAGNAGTSSLTVTSDAVVPTVAITSPSSTGSFTTTTTPVAVSGTASDNIGVSQVAWTNDRGGSGTASGTTSWTIGAIALQPGANVLTVSAQDAVGNVATSTLAVTYNVPDNTPPTISITTPTNAATFTTNATTLTVGGTAADNVGVTQVTWTNDRGGSSTATGTTSWLASGIALLPGTNVITVTAQDAANNPTTATLTVTQDATVPSVTLTAPAAGATVSGSATTLTASATDDNAMAGVQFLLDGATAIGAEVTGAGPNYTMAWNTLGVTNGTHTLTARARDAAGNTVASAGVTVTVSNTQAAGLVAAYGFEESTDAAVVDASGNNNNGTFGSGIARTVKGHAGAALLFFGNGMITIPNSASLQLTAGMTLEAWVKPSATSGTWADVVYKGNDNYFLMGSSTNGSRPAGGGIFGGGGTTSTFGTAALAADTWSHVAATYDGAVLRFFLNGTQVSTTAKTGNIATSTNPLTIGGDPLFGQNFAGTIDEVRVYNRALSVAEITNDMTTPVTDPAPATVPAIVGQWSDPFDWPLVGIHTALLKTGEVLSWEYDGAGGPFLWNPLTGEFTSVPQGTNKFCGGQAALPDGRIFVAGGHNGSHVGLPDVNIFDPSTRVWTAGPSMATGRWYPTVTALADGRSLIMSGEINCDGCNQLIPEVYNPLTNQLTRLSGASQNFTYYPHTFVLPDGRVLVAGSAEAPVVTKVLDLNTQTWSVVDPNAVDGGSSVMYLPGKIMKAGTSHNPDLPPDPSAATTYLLDMTQGSPQWASSSPMAFPRTYHNLTVLPDGNVLATGGGVTTDPINTAGAVYAAELWSPTTQKWATLSSGSVPRLYHSTAILLPDGRVLVTGMGRFNGFPASGPLERLDAEIFSPPYLFKGTRPTITSAPDNATYGGTVSVQTPDAASISSVALIKLSAVTHSFNMEQRFVPLSFTANANGLDIQMPANANLAPPGYYMLFIVNGDGVPSVAPILQMK